MTMVAETVRLLDIRDEPLSLAEVESAVVDPTAGGVALFAGRVRDHDHDRPVAGLHYTAHPTALDRLRSVADSVVADHPTVVGVAAVHRVGDLTVGDVAVVVAVSSAHRGEALAACRDLIDRLKTGVPIWKHQRFADGTEEWVGTP